MPTLSKFALPVLRLLLAAADLNLPAQLPDSCLLLPARCWIIVNKDLLITPVCLLVVRDTVYTKLSSYTLSSILKIFTEGFVNKSFLA